MFWVKVVSAAKAILLSNVVSTAKQVSEVVRPVRCEHCRTEYVYRQRLVSVAEEKWAFGIGGRPDFRRMLASDQKEQRNQTFLPVPCPVCFRYTGYMAEWLRKDFKDGRFTSGATSLLSAVLVAGLAWTFGGYAQWKFLAPLTWMAAGFLALMTTIYAVLWYRSRYFDPNADQHILERKGQAEEKAKTREQFEAGEREAVRKALAERLENAEKRSGENLEPVSVPVWLGFRTTLVWEVPQSASVTLPTGEVFEFDIPDDVREFEAFDLKREVDGEEIVFRCVLRHYHPTKL